MPRKKLDELAFTLRVYRESVQKLDYIAGANGRSRNSEINQAIKQYIARYERENGPIERAEGDGWRENLFFSRCCGYYCLFFGKNLFIMLEFVIK